MSITLHQLPNQPLAIPAATAARTSSADGQASASGGLLSATRAAGVLAWNSEPLLARTGVLLLALAIPAAAGIWLDSRLITGAPAWLKPVKFALSTGIYSLALAIMFTCLRDWPRTRRIVGRISAAVMLIEVAIIYLQAARGTTSHFNFNSLLDGALFTIMGIGIVAQTAASVAVAVALWRQEFADRALGWALRLGMTITIIGAFSGGLMNGPTPRQLAAVRATGQLTQVGAHTVGGPDGGPGLPVTNWSTAHGDLRVPHFIGLHAMQALPLIALLLPRRRSERARTRTMFAAAIVYCLLFVGTLLQALLGLPLLPLG